MFVLTVIIARPVLCMCNFQLKLGRSDKAFTRFSSADFNTDLLLPMWPYGGAATDRTLLSVMVR